MNANGSGPGNARATILVIEDDRSLREGLAMNLRLQGCDVVTAADGQDGLQAAFEAKPDLIVLDLMLPRLGGLEVLDELRSRGATVPVLILSARGATTDKVEGLRQGADDYLAKPFDRSELIARIEAMLRRRRAEEQSAPPLRVGEVEIDRASRCVRVRGRKIELSAREFDLLCLLATAPGRVFTREAIIEKVWGWDYDGTARTVDNFIANLRKKLEAGRRAPRLIRTVPRVGYTLNPPAQRGRRP